MLYPTVTEKPVRLEPVGHDPFIDGLPAGPVVRPSPAPARPALPR